MKLYFVFALFLVILFNVCTTFPVDNRDSPKEDKSAFGQPFDEIVVESSLTVRRKNYSRQGRNENIAAEPATVSNTRVKRQFIDNFGGRLQFPAVPSGSASAANAQAQSFDVKGPLGGFGASASGAQSQSIGFGPGGPTGSAGSTGSQQYRLANGQVIDVTFGNSFTSGSGTAAQTGTSGISITNPDGTKKDY